MRRHVLSLVLACCVLSASYAQRRTTGTSRDPVAGNSSSERSARSEAAEKPKANPISTSNEHESQNQTPFPIIIIIDNSPILTGDDVVRGGISNTIAQDEGEIPFQVVLSGNVTSPDNSGFDFSSGETGNYNEKNVDMFLSRDGDVEDFVVGPDADIQDVGQVPIRKVESAAKGWSSTQRVAAVPGDTYVVWTWDNQYYKFNVEFVSDDQASIRWMKMDDGVRLASNIDFRDGIHHRKKTMFDR